MKKLMVALFIALSFNSNGQTYRLVIHGGAGAMSKEKMNVEKQAAYNNALQQALLVGHKVLKEGGTSLDAVVKTIQVLEDNPLFNAGKGAVKTYNGSVELDASIMDGKTLKAGAVAGITNIKSPISTARKVMDSSNHVMLSGKGAEEFALLMGETKVEPSYFLTTSKEKNMDLTYPADEKFGTVGCVALDKYGNIAAGTSTGGMSKKRWNRIGDSPIIGAGTYANNETCGVSSTGHGEYFIRGVIAYDISAKMEYQNKSLEEASAEVILGKLVHTGGTGGVIAMDKKGNISMTFNTPGMFRGYIFEDGIPYTAIFKDQ